jgi:signal transduction histidine kinase
MSNRKVGQKYFGSKEVRISIALIILWSLLATAFFTYVAKLIGEKVGYGTFLFALVMLGYIVVVVILTMHFSHRLVGPFQRLKTEMRLIMAGEYRRRLNVRKNDDLYIKSFIEEANKMLNVLEKAHSCKEDIMKHFDSELSGIISLVEDEKSTKEKIKDSLLAFHKKITALEEKHQG